MNNTVGAASMRAGSARSGGDSAVGEGVAPCHSARAAWRQRMPADVVPASRSRAQEAARRRHGIGLVAHAFGASLRVEVLESEEGFYIGTREDGLPFSRESVEFFPSRAMAERALMCGAWTQRRPVAPDTAPASPAA